MARFEQGRPVVSQGVGSIGHAVTDEIVITICDICIMSVCGLCRVFNLKTLSPESRSKSSDRAPKQSPTTTEDTKRRWNVADAGRPKSYYGLPFRCSTIFHTYDSLSSYSTRGMSGVANGRRRTVDFRGVYDILGGVVIGIQPQRAR